jgi:hypothetical protein
VFLLSPKADMHPGDLQALVLKFREQMRFGLLIGEAIYRLTRGFTGEHEPFGTAAPAHWSHTDQCGITKKRRFLTRRQSVGRSSSLFGPECCRDRATTRCNWLISNGVGGRRLIQNDTGGYL